MNELLSSSDSDSGHLQLGPLKQSLSLNTVHSFSSSSSDDDVFEPVQWKSPDEYARLRIGILFFGLCELLLEWYPFIVGVLCAVFVACFVVCLTPSAQGVHELQPGSRFEQSDLEDGANTIMDILVPVCITMVFVIFVVKFVTFPYSSAASIVMVYQEDTADAGVTKYAMSGWDVSESLRCWFM
jgi:hypothetical protein